MIENYDIAFVHQCRIRNVQSETTRLQQQLLGIDREHKNVISQQHILHEKDSSLYQELLTMEENLNRLVLGGHDPIDRNEESAETLVCATVTVTRHSMCIYQYILYDMYAGNF